MRWQGPHIAATEFLDKGKILHNFESGFKKIIQAIFPRLIWPKKCSTVLTGMILIGLQKAFDTKDHDTKSL